MSDYYKFRQHIGHNLTIVDNGGGDELAIECEDCDVVMAEAFRPNYMDEEDDGEDWIGPGWDDDEGDEDE